MDTTYILLVSSCYFLYVWASKPAHIFIYDFYHVSLTGNKDVSVTALNEYTFPNIIKQLASYF